MKKHTFFFLGLLFTGLLLNSCQKSDKVIVNNEKITSIVEMMSLYNTDDIDEFAINSNKTALKCHCLNIIYHQNESGELWPISLTFDFGEENCEYPSGVFRRGKIHYTLTDFWMNNGAERIIEFEDFYLNDIQLLGVKTVKNTGINENENPTWEITIENGGIIDTLGNARTLNANLYGEMVEGANTWDFHDNAIEMTGTSSGSDNGASFTAEITIPLRYNFGCWYPVSGEIQLIMGSQTIIVNYGDGECDNKATIQIGDGEPEEITLGNHEIAGL